MPSKARITEYVFSSKWRIFFIFFKWHPCFIIFTIIHKTGQTVSCHSNDLHFHAFKFVFYFVFLKHSLKTTFVKKAGILCGLSPFVNDSQRGVLNYLKKIKDVVVHGLINPASQEAHSLTKFMCIYGVSNPILI